MNVALLSTFHLNGGAGVAATRLHRALLKNGISSSLVVEQVTKPESGVLGLANNFLDQKWSKARFALDRLSFVPFEKDKSVRFQFSPAHVGANISEHIAVQQADVVHLHWTNFGFLSLSDLERLIQLGKPIIWTLHDMWAFTGGCHYTRGCLNFEAHCQECPYLRRPGPHDLSARVFDRKMSILARSINLHIVAPSHWMAEEAARSRLLGRFPITTISNTLDQSVFRPIDKMTAQSRFGLKNPTQIRLLFGSFNTTDPRKGFSFFTKALTLLTEQHPDLKPEILIFGKGQTDALAHLPYSVRQLGVLTTDNDIVAAYNAADALVVPSLEDNLPNTIVESLSCGTPVIGFRTGGIPEMIRHKQTGYLAQVGSAQELAEGLAFILTHNSPAQLRHNARTFAETNFPEVAIARKHIDLYERSKGAVG